MNWTDKLLGLWRRLPFVYSEDPIEVDVVGFEPLPDAPREPKGIPDRASRSPEDRFDPEAERVTFTPKKDRSTLAPLEDRDGLG